MLNLGACAERKETGTGRPESHLGWPPSPQALSHSSAHTTQLASHHRGQATHTTQLAPGQAMQTTQRRMGHADRSAEDRPSRQGHRGKAIKIIAASPGQIVLREPLADKIYYVNLGTGSTFPDVDNSKPVDKYGYQQGYQLSGSTFKRRPSPRPRSPKTNRRRAPVIH